MAFDCQEIKGLLTYLLNLKTTDDDVEQAVGQPDIINSQTDLPHVDLQFIPCNFGTKKPSSSEDDFSDITARCTGVKTPRNSHFLNRPNLFAFAKQYTVVVRKATNSSVEVLHCWKWQISLG